MNPMSVGQFIEAGCQWTKSLAVFNYIHASTSGNPCQTGCAYYEGGKCEAFRQLFPNAQIKRPPMTKGTQPVSKSAFRTTGYVAPSKKPFKW